MKKYKRIFVIVIDSLGVGAMQDAKEYGDVGANTLGHILENCPGLHLPALEQLGLLSLVDSSYRQKKGYCMKLNEASKGKDTMTGHWEMTGLRVDTPFQTFTETGFPDDLVEALEERCGRKIVGNKAASGTVILEEYGEAEINENKLIVYTSADSVLQICGNEETMGLEQLYEYCEIARELTMKEEWKIGRVIARPYTGQKKGNFVRTSNRRDYALKPYGKTVLNGLKENGYDVISIGKIEDIFDGEGITKALHSQSSVHGMEQTIAMSKEDFIGLCFVNLVDFDALWGHRRNVDGYGKELERFDELLMVLLHQIREDDLLMVCADHGNDPTFKGSDHTREQVPLLAYSLGMQQSGKLEDANTFAVIGASIADNFDVEMPENCIGTSLLQEWI